MLLLSSSLCSSVIHFGTFVLRLTQASIWKKHGEAKVSPDPLNKNTYETFSLFVFFFFFFFFFFWENKNACTHSLDELVVRRSLQVLEWHDGALVQSCNQRVAAIVLRHAVHRVKVAACMGRESEEWEGGKEGTLVIAVYFFSSFSCQR